MPELRACFAIYLVTITRMQAFSFVYDSILCHIVLFSFFVACDYLSLFTASTFSNMLIT